MKKKSPPPPRFYEVFWELLLLSRFSRVRLCDPIDGSASGSTVPGILQARTLERVAISFSNAWKWKVKVKSLSHVWLLATPMDCSLPGSSIHGIFQALQEWSAIAFSILRVETGLYFSLRKLNKSPEKQWQLKNIENWVDVES